MPATDPELRAEIIDTVRRFVAKEVIPVAAEFEREDRFPADIVQGMRELGLFGVTIPEEHGGLGLDLLTYVGVIEELAYGWMTLSGVINTHTMVATLLMHHGTDEQRARWLPSMATGEKRGALSLSEPDAGSDTRNISCKAALDGEEYVLNGTKAWVTNGELASLVALAARTDEGISALRRREGARAELRGHLREPAHRQARLQGHRDRRDGLRGPPHPRGEPHRRGRPGPPADPRRPRDRSHQHRLTRRRRRPRRLRCRARYAQQRRTFGKAIAEHQAIQLKLADMATKLEAARLLTRNAAERKAAGLRCDVEAGMAKLFASETAMELATDSMRIHGGMGYTTEMLVERLYRDAPLMIIGEGTNEIQRLVIARGLLARARAT